MDFRFAHNNLNVLNLEKSLDFYGKALGLKEVRRKKAKDRQFYFVLPWETESPSAGAYMARDREEPYNLGDNEIHLAFTVDDMEKAMELHKEMDCVCYENPGMGIYFISDPDGYWLGNCT